MTLRIIFMGTPEFSVPLLGEIAGQGHEIVACYTRAPKPGGRRGLEPVKSPVHQAAERFGIPVFTPRTLRDGEAAAEFAAHEADVAVVAAYGLILPKAVLAAPRFGCLNLHASLLPRWRGAAPIQRAIMAGDAETGMMVMKMDVGLDTGPVALTAHFPIGPDMTAGELHDELMGVGADLMVEALDRLERGELTLTPQPEEGVLYAAKIDKAETRIDWTRPAVEIHNHIRGLSPFPGAWCEAAVGGKAERLKILRSVLAAGTGAPGTVLDDRLTVACGDGAVRLTEVQRAGGRPVPAAEFLRGAKMGRGATLG